MITVTSNLSEVIGIKLAQVKELQGNPDPVLRFVALTVLPELVHRVHTEGLDSQRSAIGTYSPGYMVVRTGNYKNAQRFIKGAKKGQVKNAGVFTDATIRLDKNTGVFSGEEKPGTARPNYHRTDDTKVILSLTRQMENDTSVIDTPEGYGIGYLNNDNFKKAMYCEATYGKKILSQLSKDEEDLAYKAADNFTAQYLNTQ